MFVIPALLSITLDATLVVVYLRQPELFGIEKVYSPVALIDALAASLRLLFLLPYIWSFMHRLRLVYSFVPWTWEAANMALSTARLVFLLSGLVPFDVQYFLVVISYASILLQATCLEHLRSSAPREKRIFLAGSVNRVDASTRLLDPAAGHPSSSTELYDGHQDDVDFIATITTKMKRAKEYWTGKTEALRILWNDLSRTREEQYSYFNLVLRLFTYEDVLGEMDEAFAHDPASLEFYIPQLVTFLLYGAYWSSASLQAFLIDKCSRSIQFSHRLYWFLNSSCLNGSGINDEGVRQVTELIEEVKNRGQQAAWKLEQGRTVQELQALAGGEVGGGHHHQEGRGEGRWSGTTRDSNESRASSTNAESKEHDSSSSAGKKTHTYIDIGNLNSNALPDTRHLCVSPRDAVPHPPSSPQRRFLEAGAYKGSDGDLFGVLPSFIDGLIKVAQDLMIVPRDRRNESLRTGLDGLSARYLPSNLIYMPVGNTYHRVWKIHSVESFSFSTKERVPCLICLEVVDYVRPRKGAAKKKWWNMDHHLPALSHTFRFGNKEWTLKIGEPKKGTGAVERRPSDFVDGLDAPLQAAKSQGGSPSRRRTSSTAAAVSPGRHVRVGSYPNPTDVGGMGQWASKQRSASVDIGGSNEGEMVSPNGGVGEAREEAPYPKDPMLLPSNKDSMREPLMTTADGDGREGKRANGSRQGVQNGRPQLTLSDDKAEAVGASDYREEKDLSGGVGISAGPGSSGTGQQRNQAGGAVGDDYGTFSPMNSPTYAGSSSPPAATIASAGAGVVSAGNAQIEIVEREESENHRDLKGGGGPIKRSSSRGASLNAAVAPTSPSIAQPPVIFKERWRQKEARIRKQSPIGHLPRWRLLPVIVKAKDDLRQEQFASQLLRQIEQIIRDADLPVWMRPYDIIATSYDGGLIEAIPDTVSLDALRKNDPHYTTLADFFERLFAQRGLSGLAKARQCFLGSLAAYSIICFILQIKDRHNGNILLDAEGHLIHIDFGFMLAKSPGNVNFERAPFKLTSEFVDVLGGPRSACFKRFRELCVKMYMELRRQRHKIILVVEMVVTGNENLPCFAGNAPAAVEALRQRFQPELNDRACMDYVNSLIDQSLDNWRTRWYDRYQSCFVGIA